MPLLTRRNFLRGAIASLAVGGATYVYARTIEPTWLDIVRLDLRLRNLPDAFAGFRIAQISDLHFGPLIQPSHIEPVIDQVIEQNADAIVITGDLVSRVTQGEPDMIVQTLSRLHAPHGVYAVLGNHDWNENGPVVIDALRHAGVNVLCNEHLTWQRDGQTIHLAGVDDVCCGKYDLDQTLHGIPANAAILALVHEPDYADIIARDPRVILQLSGHSHGGQIRIPFYGGLLFPRWGRKYPIGLYQIHDLTLYTNRGIGMYGLPLRFACRPELTVFTLNPAGSRSAVCSLAGILLS
jgi:predicted MPP superfamily phosphohydrolase